LTTEAGSRSPESSALFTFVKGFALGLGKTGHTVEASFQESFVLSVLTDSSSLASSELGEIDTLLLEGLALTLGENALELSTLSSAHFRGSPGSLLAKFEERLGSRSVEVAGR